MATVVYGLGFVQANGQNITRTLTDPSVSVSTPLNSYQVLPALAAGTYTQSIHPSATICAFIPPSANTQPLTFGGVALAEGLPFVFCPSHVSPPASISFVIGGTGLATGSVFQMD